MNRTDDITSITEALEAAYDIPFEINTQSLHADPIITIRPKHTDDLFSLVFTIKQKTRLTVNFKPDRYSAPMFEDMALSSAERKQSFVNYALYLRDNYKASMEMRINETQVAVDDYSRWPDWWRTFYFRLTKSPITNDDESFDAIKIFTKWAVVIFGMFLSLLDIVPIDEETPKYAEGAKSEVIVNRYERNPLNRQLCIAANGCYCNICGFNFKGSYGPLGDGFIHVHHIEQVSSYGGAQYINPVTDMIPVCPNCHAMLHRKDPPLKPEELKVILIDNC